MNDEYKYYAFTIRRTVSVSTVKQSRTCIKRYHDLINYVKRLNPDLYIDVTLECKPDNKKYNVHMHGMIKSKRELKINIFPRQKGLHIYIEQCKSKIAYQAYLARGELTIKDIEEMIETKSIIDKKTIIKNYEPKDEIPEIYKKYNLFTFTPI